VSRDEQKKRFLERLENPNKHWKFSEADIAERGFWKDYMKAYEEALSATSTQWAPWYVVPADRKWVSRAVVAEIVTATIASLNLSYPTVSKARKVSRGKAQKSLEAEK
ncbi:MAG: polyphosphate kinase 2 family protein, partial [Bacteroidota bacterium]